MLTHQQSNGLAYVNYIAPNCEQYTQASKPVLWNVVGQTSPQGIGGITMLVAKVPLKYQTPRTNELSPLRDKAILGTDFRQGAQMVQPLMVFS